MVFHRHIPPFPLNSYVDCLVYIEGNNKGTGFPKTAMSLVFNLNDSFKLYTDNNFSQHTDYRKYWVAGLQTGPTYVESYGESKMVVVQFKSFGAGMFLAQPLKNFTELYVPLDDVFSREAGEVWEQLKEADAIVEMFALVENFLCRRLLQHKMRNEKQVAALEKAARSRNLPVQQICRQYNVSRKHLNFLFKEYIGVSPKMLSSLNRFQSILSSIVASRPEKLTHLAYELDFFDQSHFNNQFKRFTGIRPNDYIRQTALQPSLRVVPHFLPAEDGNNFTISGKA
jgi:AraC-like DNA-binding protein